MPKVCMCIDQSNNNNNEQKHPNKNGMKLLREQRKTHTLTHKNVKHIAVILLLAATDLKNEIAHWKWSKVERQTQRLKNKLKMHWMHWNKQMAFFT